MNSSDRPFLTDIQELRRRAREDMEKGAVTPAYGLDLTQAIGILNRVLASRSSASWATSATSSWPRA